MELDALKAQWNLRYTPENLRHLFEQKTKRQLQSINRKMLIDALLSALAILGCIGVAFAMGLRERLSLSLSLVTVLLVLATNYRIKHYLLNRVNLSNDNLGDAIGKLLRTLQLYMQLYNLVVPMLVGTMYIWWLFGLHLPHFYPIQEPYFWPKALAIVPVVLLCYAVCRRLGYVLYGKELESLKNNYAELLDQKHE